MFSVIIVDIWPCYRILPHLNQLCKNKESLILMLCYLASFVYGEILCNLRKIKIYTLWYCSFFLFFNHWTMHRVTCSSVSVKLLYKVWLEMQVHITKKTWKQHEIYISRWSSLAYFCSNIEHSLTRYYLLLFSRNIVFFYQLNTFLNEMHLLYQFEEYHVFHKPRYMNRFELTNKIIQPEKKIYMSI